MKKKIFETGVSHDLKFNTDRILALIRSQVYNICRKDPGKIWKAKITLCIKAFKGDQSTAKKKNRK